VKTVAKAVTILKQFTGEQLSLGVTAISKNTGIDKAIVHRILQTLIAEGLVVKDPVSRKYSLGPEILRMAENHISQNQPLEIARPHLQKVWEATNETVHLCVRQGDWVSLTSVLESGQPVRVASKQGELSPLHCTAAGKVFLAFADGNFADTVLKRPLQKFTENTVTDAARLRKAITKVQSVGYAFGLEEYGEGFCSVAAPIFDSHERCIAAITVAMPISRAPKSRLNELAVLLVKTCSEISQEF
jgi:DNA-binding IclR family transcriptional regulator